MTTDFQPGSTFGDYILDAYLGGGSFGAVWRGHHAASGEAVALKLLTGALSSDDRASVRADMELLAAEAASRSPHVVHVLDGGTDPLPYIVMEYIEGSDLEALLRVEGKLSVQRTIDVGLAIADALAAMNEAGIIHRDIKPANVMIDSRGVIRLTDFGIAKIVGYESMTMTGQVAMTMAYAAPEVWDDPSDYGTPSHRSDLYATGVLLYQCLSGATPFRGNYGALYRAHMQQEPDLSALPAATPPSLLMLIRRSLEKRQEDRPQDAEECILMLRRAQAELDAAGTPDREPEKLGPWIKDAPHEALPWAWHCHHESNGETATVEVHFAERLNYGTTLQAAVAGNDALRPFGAERLLGSSRLLLRPTQAWLAPPPGRFQFWVAREDKPVTPATTVTPAMLATAVSALKGLIEAAEAAGLLLAFGPNLTVLQDGSIYLRRPGIVAVVDADMRSEALAALRALPLDSEAQALMASVPTLQALATGLAQPRDDATVSLDRRATERVPATAATVVLPAAERAPIATTAARPVPAARTEPVPTTPSRAWVRPGLLAGGALAVVAAAVLAITAFGAGGGGNGSKGRGTPVVEQSAAAAASAEAPTATAQPPAQPTTSPPVQVAAPRSCDVIRSSGSYLSDEERSYFLASCGNTASNPTPAGSSVGAPAAPAIVPPTATSPPAGAVFTFVGFSDHLGPANSAPSDVTPPGGTLRSCNPSSLYAFVNFSNLQPPKDFVAFWSENGIFLSQRTLTETVSSASTFWQVQNNPAALNPGTYRFQISIAGGVVTQGAFTLAC